jgi:hypothetical protein
VKRRIGQNMCIAEQRGWYHWPLPVLWVPLVQSVPLALWVPLLCLPVLWVPLVQSVPLPLLVLLVPLVQSLPLALRVLLLLLVLLAPEDLLHSK